MVRDLISGWRIKRGRGRLIVMKFDMTRTILAGATLVLVSPGSVHADERFEKAAVHFEQNATDEDAEVTFEVAGRDDGLATLKGVAPDGRIVISFDTLDSKLGIRQIRLESPEPQNVSSVKADFLEGEYTFTGTTVPFD
jgi:hypothetical protein